MTSASITRRIFLRTLVCLSAFGLRRPTHALARLATSGGPDPLAANLARIFVHKNSAAIVGIEYLRTKLLARLADHMKRIKAS